MNIFKFYQEHQKMKALISVLHNRHLFSTKDIMAARQVYTDLQTLCFDNDEETKKRIAKTEKKHDVMLGFYNEDEVDTVDILNDWLSTNVNKSSRRERENHLMKPKDSDDEDDEDPHERRRSGRHRVKTTKTPSTHSVPHHRKV